MEFTAVLRRNAPATVEFEYDDEFIKDFMNAWSYCSAHPDQYLECEFATAQKRETWLAKARAYGLTLQPKLEVRRIKRTDSTNPEHGKLQFVIELKSLADARRQKIHEANRNREARREAGELIQKGKRLNPT